MDFERRVAIEKELDKQIEHLNGLDLEFDESDRCIIFTCMMGVKLVHIASKRLIALLGKNETERFIKLSLY